MSLKRKEGRKLMDKKRKRGIQKGLDELIEERKEINV